MLVALTAKKEYGQAKRLRNATLHFLIIDMRGHLLLLLFMKLSLAPPILKIDNFPKRYTNSSLFPTLISKLKFGVFHLTSDIAEVKGGPKK